MLNPILNDEDGSNKPKTPQDISQPLYEINVFDPRQNRRSRLYNNHTKVTKATASSDGVPRIADIPPPLIRPSPSGLIHTTATPIIRVSESSETPTPLNRGVVLEQPLHQPRPTLNATSQMNQFPNPPPPTSTSTTATRFTFPRNVITIPGNKDTYQIFRRLGVELYNSILDGTSSRKTRRSLILVLVELADIALAYGCRKVGSFLEFLKQGNVHQVVAGLWIICGFVAKPQRTLGAERLRNAFLSYNGKGNQSTKAVEQLKRVIQSVGGKEIEVLSTLVEFALNSPKSRFDYSTFLQNLDYFYYVEDDTHISDFDFEYREIELKNQEDRVLPLNADQVQPWRCPTEIGLTNRINRFQANAPTVRSIQKSQLSSSSTHVPVVPLVVSPVVKPLQIPLPAVPLVPLPGVHELFKPTSSTTQPPSTHSACSQSSEDKCSAKRKSKKKDPVLIDIIDIIDEDAKPDPNEILILSEKPSNEISVLPNPSGALLGLNGVNSPLEPHTQIRNITLPQNQSISSASEGNNNDSIPETFTEEQHLQFLEILEVVEVPDSDSSVSIVTNSRHNMSNIRLPVLQDESTRNPWTVSCFSRPRKSVSNEPSPAQPSTPTFQTSTVCLQSSPSIPRDQASSSCSTLSKKKKDREAMPPPLTRPTAVVAKFSNDIAANTQSNSNCRSKDKMLLPITLSKLSSVQAAKERIKRTQVPFPSVKRKITTTAAVEKLLRTNKSDKIRIAIQGQKSSADSKKDKPTDIVDTSNESGSSKRQKVAAASFTTPSLQQVQQRHDDIDNFCFQPLSYFGHANNDSAGSQQRNKAMPIPRDLLPPQFQEDIGDTHVQIAEFEDQIPFKVPENAVETVLTGNHTDDEYVDLLFAPTYICQMFKKIDGILHILLYHTKTVEDGI